MKSLKDIVGKTTSPDSTTNSSSPDAAPLKIVCYDPASPGERCPLCGGMGLIKYDVPIEDPRFGKLLRCPNYPVEADVERQERLRKLSNLDAFKDKTFTSFEIDTHRYQPRELASLKIALDLSRKFAENPDGWLLLEGTYGCGKTHLAAAVGNMRLKFGEFVLFVTVPDLLDYLRGTYSPDSEITYDETFERIRTVPLLILDDIGAESPSHWAQEKLFQLLNYRYVHRKPTIITTNVSLGDLDARVRSRLIDTGLVRHVRIVAPDYRSSVGVDDRLIAGLSTYSSMTFEAFSIAHNLNGDEKKNLVRVYQAAQKYAEKPAGWFFIVGDDGEGDTIHGNGKTHLAAAIALRRREIGDQVIFGRLNDIMDYLRETFGTSSHARLENRMEILRDVDLLVIDDLHTRNATDWAKEKIFQILDYRYVRRLPVVVTAAATTLVDNRLMSRLADAGVSSAFKLKAPSYYKTRR